MARLRVLVTVGTDHHPFDRLIDAVDGWAEGVRARGLDLDLTVQHGASRPARWGDNHSLVSHTQILAMIDQADIVVAQGGPGSIIDAGRLGHRPVVLARTPERSEVIDAHQHDFCAAMARAGRIHLAQNEHELAPLLDDLAADPGRARIDPITGRVPEASAAVLEHVRGAVTDGPGCLSLRRLRAALRRQPGPISP